MKILFVGVYRDGTGWAHQAIDYIRALVCSGADVVCRHVKLNDINLPIPADIEALEQKNLLGVDVCIQHLLPEHMEWNSKCKHIGLINVESDNILESGWANYLNMLDEVWVPGWHAQRACDVLEKMPNIIQTPMDIAKLDKVYQPISIPELNDTFVFYFIGEFSRRKNLSALIKAFHCEFAPEEPVSLLIKTSGSPQDIDGFCREIKNGLRLYKNPNYYKQEVIITDFLSDEDIMKVHATGDCFVMPSLGEGWNIPAAEACALGKTPIMTDWGGPLEFINEQTAYPVDYHLSPAFGMIDTLPNLYSGFENFAQIDIGDLMRNMRLAYENKELRLKKAAAGKEYMRRHFSYEAIGARIKEVLGAK